MTLKAIFPVSQFAIDEKSLKSGVPEIVTICERVSALLLIQDSITKPESDDNGAVKVSDELSPVSQDL